MRMNILERCLNWLVKHPSLAVDVDGFLEQFWPFFSSN